MKEKSNEVDRSSSSSCSRSIIYNGRFFNFSRISYVSSSFLSKVIKMTEHTPTPWHRNIPPASKYPTIFSGRNKHVAQIVTRGLPEDEIEANAAFLVEAVNNHEALKARVKELEEFLKRLQIQNIECSVTDQELNFLIGEECNR